MVNIIAQKENGLYIAHCLELDIVAVNPDLPEVRKEIAELIQAQINYAIENNNLENLYFPAPKEVWREFIAHTKLKKGIRWAKDFIL